VWNISRIFPCLLEFFMSRICPVLFVQNLSRIFYVQNLSSFICLEFVQKFLCLEYVQFYLSRICPEFFHVQNMSGKNFWNFSCPEYVWKKFLESFISRICPVYLSRFSSCLEYVQNLSGFLDMKNSRQSFFQTFSRHFLDMKKNF